MMLFEFFIAACCFTESFSGDYMKWLSIKDTTKVTWLNVSAEFDVNYSHIQVYKTNDSINGRPNVSFYIVADIKNKKVRVTTDTTFKRRLTPTEFYLKNHEPTIVVNGTFFDFTSNRNLNAVMKNGNLTSYNLHSVALKGKDTLLYLHTFKAAIGINKNRKADVAWLFTDSNSSKPFATQQPIRFYKDSFPFVSKNILRSKLAENHSDNHQRHLRRWKMHTAIGGGPVLIQNSTIHITNNEEQMFSGKAVDDKHPRTAIGYTSEGKLIILVVQGRTPGIAEGVSLTELAKLMLDLGCVEALNLDGGGSSCMLVNGKETIKTSDKGGQRPVPGVLLIQAFR